MTNAESEFRQAMFQAETEAKYEDAALAALGLAEMVSFRSPEGAMYCAQRAQVYATLHQARVLEDVAVGVGGRCGGQISGRDGGNDTGGIR